MSFKIYLAGPISGCSFKEASVWREWFANRLAFVAEEEGTNYKCYSPLRFKSYLNEETAIEDEYVNTTLSNQKAIFGRDRNDVFTCDLMVVNLLGTDKVSIGTMMEIAWADAKNIPILLIMEDGNIHDHCMVREACHFRATTMEDAPLIVCEILSPGV